MAWSDEPTPVQLGALGRLIHWELDADTVARAIKFLEENATRREVSTEMTRLRALYLGRQLSKETIFEAPIWEGFDYD